MVKPSSKTRFAPDACNEVKPFDADCRDVKPWCGPLTLTDGEIKLFDSIASEAVHIAGTDIRYWQLDVAGSTQDPLYREPTLRRFKGPFTMKAWVAYSQTEAAPVPEGFRLDWTSSAWIARTDVEKLGLQPPSEGDIVGFWNIPYFAQNTLDSQFTPGGGWFFNVTDVDEDGHIFDQAAFVGFTLQLARNTEFTPERRIEAR